MTTWTQKTLGEVADLCLGKMLDEQKNKGDLLPYLANVNVRWGEFDFDGLREMRFLETERERYGLKYGDIVMCEGGEPGRCAIWKESVPGMMIQKALHRIRPNKEIDHRYLFYFFLHTGYQGAFAPLFTGATIKHLPKQSLEKLEVKYPPLSQQKLVADVLSSYDDLIDNNRRRMALLEDSARQLYREWFVRLRFPGHEHTPIVNGVPQGWSKVKVGSMLLKGVKAKKIQKGEYLENGAIPCIDQGSNFIGGYTDDEEARIFEPLPLIIFGDHTRVLKYVNFPFAMGADGIQVIAPNTPCMTVECLYYALKAANISNHFYARHFKFLKEEIVMVPTEQLMREFSNIGKSGFDQINSLNP